MSGADSGGAPLTRRALREAAEREATERPATLGITPRLATRPTGAAAWPASGSVGLVRHPEVSPTSVTPPTGLPSVRPGSGAPATAGAQVPAKPVQARPPIPNRTSALTRSALLSGHTIPGRQVVPVVPASAAGPASPGAPAAAAPPARPTRPATPAAQGAQGGPGALPGRPALAAPGGPVAPGAPAAQPAPVTPAGPVTFVTPAAPPPAHTVTTAPAQTTGAGRHTAPAAAGPASTPAVEPRGLATTPAAAVSRPWSPTPPAGPATIAPTPAVGVGLGLVPGAPGGPPAIASLAGPAANLFPGAPATLPPAAPVAPPAPATPAPAYALPATPASPAAPVFPAVYAQGPAASAATQPALPASPDTPTPATALPRPAGPTPGSAAQTPPLAARAASDIDTAPQAPVTEPVAEPALPPPNLDDLDLSQRLPTVRYRGHYTSNEPLLPEEALLASGTSGVGSGETSPADQTEVATPPLPGKPDEPPSRTKKHHHPRVWHHKAPAALGLSHRPSRTTMVCIIAAVLVLCVAIPVGVLGLAGRLKAITPSPSPNVSIPASITPSPGQDGATNWAIGRELAVGDLAVTITSVEFVSQVGDDKGVSENGQFAIINLTVEYTGEDEGNFSPEFQFLRTEPAGYYRDDAEAALMYQPTTLGSEPLQPGRPRIGCLAFDIPLGFKPIALELVDQVGGDPLVVPLG